MNIKLILSLVLSFLVMIGWQNCSEVGFENSSVPQVSKIEALPDGQDTSSDEDSSQSDNTYSNEDVDKEEDEDEDEQICDRDKDGEVDREMVCRLNVEEALLKIRLILGRAGSKAIPLELSESQISLAQLKEEGLLVKALASGRVSTLFLELEKQQAPGKFVQLPSQERRGLKLRLGQEVELQAEQLYRIKIQSLDLIKHGRNNCRLRNNLRISLEAETVSNF